jgi:hypothetical protein
VAPDSAAQGGANSNADRCNLFFTELTRRAQLWAAVLSVGPGAALSHESAAEL